MARVYFDATRQVVAFKTADIGPDVPDPPNTTPVEFDATSNQVLLSILAHEPKRLRLAADNKSLTLDGNPFPINADTSDEQGRKRAVALLQKANTTGLTLQELTLLTVALARRVLAIQSSAGGALRGLGALQVDGEPEEATPAPKQGKKRQKVTRTRS